MIMDNKKFGRCHDDEEFKKVMEEALDSAKKEIIVITGEFGAYKFPELKQKVHDALSRNVKMKIYANSPSPSDVKEIKEKGGEFYIGDISSKDHYTIIDNYIVIMSEKDGIEPPTKIGERHGCTYEDPILAKKIIVYFNDLIASSFVSRMKKKSILAKFADIIFRICVRDYGKIREPKIDVKISENTN
jgi:sugar-specific transcriptional regulator TrmB